jgi:hypothetical protein
VSPLPEPFLEHLRQAGYHPRSDKHSNALATAIVRDLYAICPAIAVKAQAGTLVFDLNFDLHVRTATWNIDLVLGQPAAPLPNSTTGVGRWPPSTVQIAIEIKSVMTEHRKAVKNRKRDLEAHHEHVHNYANGAIAGGVLVVNAASQFRSPLRMGAPTIHGRGDRKAIAGLISHCVSELRNVSERREMTQEGLDAKCVLVINMDNIDPAATTYESRPPAPQAGDPLHYDAFLQRLCSQYQDRYGDP